METKVQRFGLGVIKLFRRMFLNTPVSRWKITGLVRAWFFKGLTKNELITIDYQGVKLQAPSHDLGLVPGLMGGYYERAELEVFKRLVKDADVILDVGGNIGLYANVGAKNMPEKAKLISFEPVPSNLELLRKNLILNDFEKCVVVEQLAIGAKKAKLEIYISEKSIGNHSASAENAGKDSRKIIVNQISIDQYTHSKRLAKVDVIKIDIEGYDALALQGATEVIKKYKPALLVEFIPRLIRNCGIDEVEFGGQLFDLYDHCFVVSELKEKLTPAPRNSKEQFIAAISNNNLLFVSQPSQVAAVKNFIVTK